VNLPKYGEKKKREKRKKRSLREKERGYHDL